MGRDKVKGEDGAAILIKLDWYSYEKISEQWAQNFDLSLERLINIDKVLFEEEIWRKNELLITHVKCGKQKCEILPILNVEVNVKCKYAQII